MHYATHGTARVAIIDCPNMLGRRLGHFTTKGEYSWALRDFITGMMLRSGFSHLTLSQIEALVASSQFPIYRSVQRKEEWTAELEQLSRIHFGNKYDAATPPNSQYGSWKRL